MSLRARLGRRLLGGEMDKLEQTLETMAEAYRRGPYVLTPESLVRQLSEIDSQLVDLLMMQRGYDIIAGRPGGRLSFTETDRLTVVDNSRWAFHFDSQAWRAVNAWSDWGFGKRVTVTPNDVRLQEVWEEFWTAKRNAPLLKQNKLSQLSNALVVDGEIFFIFFVARFGGQTTIRRRPTEEIVDIIHAQDDTDIPLFYERNVKSQRVWYPDWAADPERLDAVELPSDVVRADQMTNGNGETSPTDVVAMRVSYADIQGRGWPITYRAINWYVAYKEMLQDRAAVAAAVAMYPHTIKHKAGSRATDAIAARLQSSLVNTGYGTDTNPPPTAGSTWIENEAATRSANPLGTGASDGQKDSLLLLGQATAGDGLPLAYRGRPDAAQNRAIAEITTQPWMQLMDRYSSGWAATFRDIVEVVGRKMAQYGNGGEYSTYEADVSQQRPVSVSIPDLSQAMGAVDTATLNTTIPWAVGQDALFKMTKLMLESFGIDTREFGAEPASDEEGTDTTADVIQAAVTNYRERKITADQLAEFLIATALDGGKELEE